MLGNGITIELKVQTLDVQSQIDAGASGVKLGRLQQPGAKKRKPAHWLPPHKGLVAPLTVVVGLLNKTFPPSNPHLLFLFLDFPNLLFLNFPNHLHGDRVHVLHTVFLHG